MKYAFCGGKLLDGTREMQPREGLVLRTDGDRITDIVPEGTDLTGYEVVDLKGGYLMPGLINMHVHLAGSGKPQKKQRDNEKLVKTILSTGLTRKVAYGMVAGFAKEELFSGVTTIRTVGGLADFDTRLRDDIRAGRRVGPRILAANEGISVPSGHMAGSVAVAAHTIDEALEQLEKGRQQGVDLVKLMITGGVLDAKEKGVPGELKMPPEMVKVVCERAHEMGYTVAAHVESPEGVRVALENGVDSIEHGAKPDADILRLFRERGAFLCTTISPVQRQRGVRGHHRMRQGGAGAGYPGGAGQRRGLPVDHPVRLLAGAVLLPQVCGGVQRLRSVHRHRPQRPAGGYRSGDRHAGAGKGGGPHRYGGGSTGRPAGAAPCRAGHVPRAAAPCAAGEAPEERGGGAGSVPVRGDI